MKDIFNYPASGSIDWQDIEVLLLAVGSTLQEGRGSRVRFIYKGKVIAFHRPHPEKEARPYQIRDAKKFLMDIGVLP